MSLNHRGAKYYREWRIVRRQALERAGWRCEAADCGKAGRFEVHHVIALAEGGANTLANAQVLCVTCHLKVHNSFRPRREEWRAMVSELL